MGIDFSTMVKLPCQDFFGRPIIVTPIMSSPGAGAYVARGIWDSGHIEIETGSGATVILDQETIIDVRDNEFFENGWPVPIQGDLINVPADGNVPAEGDFEVTGTENDGGGETTLRVRKFEPAAP